VTLERVITVLSRVPRDESCTVATSKYTCGSGPNMSALTDMPIRSDWVKTITGQITEKGVWSGVGVQPTKNV